MSAHVFASKEAMAVAERQAQVKTKIIATVGPACEKPEMLRKLVLAGVDVFRLNFAHGTHEWLGEIAKTIRKISEELGRPIGILGDLAGPKIRLQQLQTDPMICAPGGTVEFVKTADPEHPERLTCTYETLVEDLQVGDRVLLADGTVSLRVAEKVRGEKRVVCQVEQSGPIRSRQGINLPGVALSTPCLTDKDRDDLAWALANEIDFIGLSFVRSPDDIRLLRTAISWLKPRFEPLIVAKIEKMEAVNELEKIIELTDAVMVARGDLGVEVDLAIVPGLQKRIIRLCNQHRVPVITATQMLDSMQNNSRPTRAEATDVANAVLDGTDAVMLSGETAAGMYPVEAVQTMSRIVEEAQKLLPPRNMADTSAPMRARALEVTEAVVQGASRVAETLKADLIVVATRTGKAGLATSQQRHRVPVLGVSDRPDIARRLCLSWGVTPILTEKVNTAPQELLEFIVQWGRERRLLKSGSKLVLISSSNWSAMGHDTLLVHQVM